PKSNEYPPLVLLHFATHTYNCRAILPAYLLKSALHGSQGLSQNLPPRLQSTAPESLKMRKIIRSRSSPPPRKQLPNQDLVPLALASALSPLLQSLFETLQPSQGRDE